MANLPGIDIDMMNATQQMQTSHEQRMQFEYARQKQNWAGFMIPPPPPPPVLLAQNKAVPTLDLTLLLLEDEDAPETI